MDDADRQAREISDNDCVCSYMPKGRKCRVCLIANALREKDGEIERLKKDFMMGASYGGKLRTLLSEAVELFSPYPSYGYTKEQCKWVDKAKEVVK